MVGMAEMEREGMVREGMVREAGVREGGVREQAVVVGRRQVEREMVGVEVGVELVKVAWVEEESWAGVGTAWGVVGMGSSWVVGASSWVVEASSWVVEASSWAGWVRGELGMVVGMGQPEGGMVGSTARQCCRS